MEEKKKKTERFFKPGNQYAAKKPGEQIIPHPLYPGRDTKGHPMPGNGYLQAIPEQVGKLKAALVTAVSEDQIQEVINELRKLCLPGGDHGPDIQLRAMSLFFDRVVGRPSQDVNVNRASVSVQAVKHDFSSLPTEDLRKLEDILSRSNGPVIDVTPEADG